MLLLFCFWVALLAGGGALATAATAADGLPASAGLVGLALCAVSARALAALNGNSLVALTGEWTTVVLLAGCVLTPGPRLLCAGECPACGEDVYAFVQAASRGAHAADCHVCKRPLRFDVRLTGAHAPPWQRRAAGRIVLVAHRDDFFPAD